MSGLSKLKKKRIANALFLMIIFSSLIFYSFTSKKVSGAPFNNSYFEVETRVLFDESHLPYYGISGLNPAFIRNDGYRFFSSYLEENDYEIDILNISSTINEAQLQNYDIFIICASQTPYTINEINTIYNWTINGGSLLLMSEYWRYSHGTEDLARKFGYLIFEDTLVDYENHYGGTHFSISFDENNMLNDDLFTDVTSLVFTSMTGFMLRPEDSEDVLFTDVAGDTLWGSNWNPARNVPVISKNIISDSKYGKIVVCCDTTLWDSSDNEFNAGTSSFYELDNAQFALNIMDWLATSTSKVSIPFIGVSLSLFFSMCILVFISKLPFKKTK